MGGDPVADKSGFLCMYMSNHPDTLVSYVRYWGKVSEQVSSAKMTAIDTKGMSLTYQLKGSTATKQVTVQFDPPLLGYEEVKPRLMNMKAEAEEELGMTRAPQLQSLQWSSKYLTTIIAMTFLIYSTCSAYVSAPAYAPLLAPGRVILSYLPSWSLAFSWGMVSFFHGFESLYVLYLCKKHRSGFLVGAQHVAACLALGFPVIQVMRKQVQDARIESIMKGQ